MKLVITEPTKVKAFATIFRQLKNIVADVNMEFSDESVYIQGMGQSQVCLFELLIQKDWFTEYEVNKPFVMGIHCEFMFKMLNCLEDGQKITMYMKEDADKLSVDFESIGENKTIRKCFKMPLMNIDSEHLTIPEVEYEADMSIMSDEFSDLISQLCIFGEELRINCNAKTVDLTSKGDMGQMTASIEEENIVEYAIEEDVAVNICVSLTLVASMCGFSKISEVAYLHCSNGAPVKLHYSLDDEDSTDSMNYVRFFIAPRIEDD
jgi:proliferating cell nuclear antigen